MLLLGETKRVYSGAVSPPRLASLRSSAASVCAASAPHRHTERHAGDVTLWRGRCGAVRPSVSLRRDWLSRRWGAWSISGPTPSLLLSFSLFARRSHCDGIENTVQLSCTLNIFASINFTATHKTSLFAIKFHCIAYVAVAHQIE